LKYTFVNLKKDNGTPSPIIIKDTLEETEDFTSYLFTFQTEGKTMSGQINVPKVATPSAGFPAVLMLRGYVDISIYNTGVGTKNAAAAFAQNDFITVAPDFLGYGQSDPPHANSLAARLEKPKHVLDLLASLKQFPPVDSARIGIWGHSNGGQIALSVLEITGGDYPTTLWAPVSKPFPYSILYYTDESDDQGKAMRADLAEFETDYDVFDFSIDNYYDWINAFVELHQGTADTAVPVAWSDLLVQTLEDKGKHITYFTYAGADHNLRPGWDTVVDRNLKFFNTQLSPTLSP
jgi:dipeptidyl aminopeptidase/acylaminoacyl peptidase